MLHAASTFARTGSLIPALFFVATVTAFGGIDMYLKIDGVDGESMNTNHLDWIDIEGYGHSLSSIIAPPGQAGNRHQGSTHQELVVVKRTDKSTPKLNESVCDGTVFPDITVEFDRVIGNTTSVYYRVVLKDVLVSSVIPSANASDTADMPKERVTLAYTKVTWTYHQFDATGMETEFNESYWDLIRDSGALDGTKVDTDMDGEFNPTDTDDDGDGVPDSYEDQNETLSLEDDADEDPDGDFQSNINEFLSGTFANDPLSVFKVTLVQVSPGLALLSWSSVDGKIYRTSFADNVEGPYFIFEEMIPADPGGETSRPVPFGPGSRYYIVEVVTDPGPPPP
jgi:type VI secretion system Hcp family effector